MIITTPALQLLQRLYQSSRHPVGFMFDGAVGSCRAAVPILSIAHAIPEGRIVESAGGFAFFVTPEYVEVFRTATLDYETGLFARGLNLTWPHREGGCPICSADCDHRP